MVGCDGARQRDSPIGAVRPAEARPQYHLEQSLPTEAKQASMNAVCGWSGRGHGPCGATGVALTCSASAGGAVASSATQRVRVLHEDWGDSLGAGPEGEIKKSRVGALHRNQV